MFKRPRYHEHGPRQRLSRPVGCLLWIVAVLVLLLVLSVLFGGFQKGTKVGVREPGVHPAASVAQLA